MQVRMVSLEDGITSCGFRKMAAHVLRLNEDTEAYYVTTNKYRSIPNALFGGLGAGGELSDEEVDEIAHGLAGADLVGMAISYEQLEEFAELWHDEVGIPFAVYGVIPNYVKQDKFEILT